MKFYYNGINTYPINFNLNGMIENKIHFIANTYFKSINFENYYITKFHEWIFNMTLDTSSTNSRPKISWAFFCSRLPNFFRYLYPSHISSFHILPFPVPPSWFSLDVFRFSCPFILLSSNNNNNSNNIPSWPCRTLCSCPRRLPSWWIFALVVLPAQKSRMWFVYIRFFKNK